MEQQPKSAVVTPTMTSGKVRPVRGWVYPASIGFGVLWVIFVSFDPWIFDRSGLQSVVERYHFGRSFLSSTSSMCALVIVGTVLTIWAPVNTIDAWRKLGFYGFWKLQWEAPFALLLWGLAGVVARESWLWYSDDFRSDPVLNGAVVRWYCAVLAIVTFARWVQRRQKSW